MRVLASHDACMALTSRALITCSLELCETTHYPGSYEGQLKSRIALCAQVSDQYRMKQVAQYVASMQHITVSQCAHTCRFQSCYLSQ